MIKLNNITQKSIIPEKSESYNSNEDNSPILPALPIKKCSASTYSSVSGLSSNGRQINLSKFILYDQIINILLVIH